MLWKIFFKSCWHIPETDGLRIEYAVPGRDDDGVGHLGDGVDIRFPNVPNLARPVRENTCCGERRRVGDKGSFRDFQDSLMDLPSIY